jgi:hypothetical protein
MQEATGPALVVGVGRVGLARHRVDVSAEALDRIADGGAGVRPSVPGCGSLIGFACHGPCLALAKPRGGRLAGVTPGCRVWMLRRVFVVLAGVGMVQGYYRRR